MEVNYFSIGEFKNSIKLMMKYKSLDMDRRLENVGKAVCYELKDASPRDTGELASGWNHKLEKEDGAKSVVIRNSTHTEYDVISGLEYGHGTGTGGYVKPTHFVTNTIDSMEEYISEELGGVIKDVG